MKNFDEAFIEKRRTELEGFLRYLMEGDNRVKGDSNIKAFLTFDTQKYKDFKENPQSYLDKMKSVYNAMPSATGVAGALRGQGVSQTVANLVSRFHHEIQGVEEPQLLQQDAKNIDFDET